MMKKMLIYASLTGIAAGVVYLLYKKDKSNCNVTKSDNNKVDFDLSIKKEEPSRESNVMEDMYQAKGERAQAVQERHSEAAEIMSDAFENIFSEIEPVVLDVETDDTIIDNESVVVMKEIDSISDELDDLLK